MALETLKNITAIGDAKVLAERPKKEDGSIDWELFDEQRKVAPIYIDQDVNMISFRLQKGPIQEVGINGCQIDTMIEAARLIIKGLNEKFSCDENEQAMRCLSIALHFLKIRTLDRKKRNVEGKDEK